MSQDDLAVWLLTAGGPIADDETDAQQWAKDYDRYLREHAAGARPCGCQASIALAPYVGEGSDEIPVTTTALHPARVLAECAAKRQIIAAHAPVTLRGGPGARYYDTTTVCASCSPPQFPEDAYPCPTLLRLAQPYAGRPGWRDEWATP